MNCISKYRFAQLLCIIILLPGSMLFTGHTGKAASMQQTGTQTEWLLCNANRLKKNNGAYHFTAAVGPYQKLSVCTTHLHSFFTNFQNRLSAIRYKTAVLLTRQFCNRPKHMRQKAIPCSSPEQPALS